MDKLNDCSMNKEKKKKRPSIPSALKSSVKTFIDERKKNKVKTAIDLSVLIISILFSRCHVIFGSHPLAIAFISILPSRVWISVLGAVIGALTLGRSGIIYAMISLIVMFLRVIVSGGERKDGSAVPLFGENLLLKMSASLIGGFVGAVYEVLINGFSETSVLFGVSMILLCPVITLSFSGLFNTGSDFFRGIFTKLPIFSLKDKNEREKNEAIFFQISALLFILAVSLSLSEYVIFGINLAYIFAGVITIAVSKRFGALRAAAVGFASSVALSSLYSVGFALFGITSGMLFYFGGMYSLIGGGAVLFFWCAYSGGISGVLSTLPEYSISAMLSLPLLKNISKEESAENIESSEKCASDMLGTVALSFKSRYSGNLDSLESSLSAISAITGKYSERCSKPTREELSELIDECMNKYCSTCGGFEKCDKCMYLTPESREKCITSLALGDTVTAEDLNMKDGSCAGAIGLASSISRAAAILSEEKYKAYQKDTSAEELSLISKLISEARYYDECEKSTNEILTNALLALLPEHKIYNGAARVYGQRAPHVIIACEDESGAKISSVELKRSIEKITGTLLTQPEFYKKGKIALMECSSRPRITAECAITSRAGERDKISGDTARAFESRDGRFYTMISDGMGSGREAKETSTLAADFLSGALEYSHEDEQMLGILNNIIRKRSGECSSTVDIFSIDLISGKAAFIKSGAAPSYIKRGSSLFRISSKTAPLGTLKSLDAEKISADVADGDYVIMLSDGVSQNVEDTPWLPMLLSKPPLENPADYADLILRTAIENQEVKDDMTVAVTKIKMV